MPLERIATPCFVVDQQRLGRNLEILKRVQERTEARIILALKGFATFSTFPQIRNVLCGTTASSLNEARLGAENFGGEVHVYAVAYAAHELPSYLELAHHISFNSWSQWKRFKDLVLSSGVSCGLRINPEYSEVETAIYNPCRPGTRFGVTAHQLEGRDLSGMEGFLFHTLCQQNAGTLERTLNHVEQKFGPYLHGVRWLNIGGGHHITRADYDVDLLCELLLSMRDRYQVQVYLEPGEAVVLNAGFLVASVLDVFRSGGQRIAVLDTSATAHMPDVLEAPYRPRVVGAGKPGEKAYVYSLGGLTCLAGDVIGDYSFDQPVKIGDKLIFADMAHYTMVKTTMFNGIQHPSIGLFDPKRDEFRVIRTFGYEDYRSRLS